MTWLQHCARWQLAAEQTGGRFLSGNPRTGRISLLWGRQTRLVRV